MRLSGQAIDTSGKRSNEYLGLTPDDLGYGRPGPLSEPGRFLAPVVAVQQPNEIGGPGQAAGVRGADARHPARIAASPLSRSHTT